MILNEQWSNVDASDFIEKISIDNEEIIEPLKYCEISDPRPKEEIDKKDDDDDSKGLHTEKNVIYFRKWIILAILQFWIKSILKIIDFLLVENGKMTKKQFIQQYICYFSFIYI